MLKIDNLHVSIEGKKIIKGLSLTINKGEVHALMGPNGSGKSTLSYVLSGKEGYEIDEGTIEYNGKNLLDLDVDERANLGLFLAFQYPMEIPGVQTSFFLKTAINSKRKFLGMPEIDALEFAKLIKSHAEDLGIGSEMLKRDLNVNYSGGEKKKQEILQMSILKPDMAILDETDSGLDIDALRIVSEGVNKLRSEQNSFLVITAVKLHTMPSRNMSDYAQKALLNNPFKNFKIENYKYAQLHKSITTNLSLKGFEPDFSSLNSFKNLKLSDGMNTDLLRDLNKWNYNNTDSYFRVNSISERPSIKIDLDLHED